MKNKAKPEEKVEMIRPRIIGHFNIFTKRIDPIIKTKREATLSMSSAIPKNKSKAGRVGLISIVDNIEKNTKEDMMSEEDEEESLVGLDASKCWATATKTRTILMSTK